MSDTKSLRLPNYENCFVCGHKNVRGFQAPFYRDNGRVISHFTTEDWMVGFENVVHGGIISTMLDEIAIWAVYEATGKFGMTAELNVRFLRPLLTGNDYHLAGWLTEDRGKLWIAESQMYDENEKVYAKAKAKVFPVPEEKNNYYQKGMTQLEE